MKQSYHIAQKVWGSHGSRHFDYLPGDVTPKDPSEAVVLEHLVSIGLAEVTAAEKSKKKEA